MRRLGVVLLAVLVVLHQDFWWWHRIDPLVFGFIPIGLMWHVGISLGAAGIAALAVRFWWPDDLEVPDGPGELRSRGPLH